MSDDDRLERPFVPRRGVPVDDRHPPTREWLKETRALLAATPRPKPVTPKPQPTDTERLAIARKRLDEEGRRP